MRQSVTLKCLWRDPVAGRGFLGAGCARIYIYCQRKMEALNIVAQHMQQNLDEYTIFCYFAPCNCHIETDFCTRCDEVGGDENAIQKQLVSNAIKRLCTGTCK